MLRKFGHIILSSLLIITTVGFVVSKHYCSDEIISVTVNSPTDKCCDNMGSNCCHDENEYIILKVDYTPLYTENANISEIDLLDNKYIEFEYSYTQTESSDYEYPYPFPISGTLLSLAKKQSYLL